MPSASKNGDVVRARAAGAELVKLHDWFRQELALLRAGARTTMTDDLRSRCLVFCGGLERHHGAEDHVAFPFLDERFPELRPALNELRAEHARIEHLRAELNQLVETGTPTPADFDSLAAELTAHLDREERLLVPLLNALPEAPWP